MQSEAVRDLKWMVLGAAFTTTGSAFYAASTPASEMIRTLGFPFFIVGLVALVAGFVGEPPSRWIR
ncbi:hypothetical protein [Halococcus hamelinensis]|uniref:Uncharacterized protein n=1 Tax=Halococcus hamelinensis 100A6 TaxID=1132509 RepID=M0LWC4_9EURY|nr:hypothetical protein [Halococcus hamelinensis]EMA37771.1 hypothetical protein C447_12385 [Halococcus hamelinensis 100A6]